MYDPQHCLDLQQATSTMRGLSLQLSSSTGPSSSNQAMLHSQLDQHHGGVGSSNVDRLLFNDLVEIVPLVQSLIDTKAKSSFTRRGSVTYTKTPSRECLPRKMVEHKGRITDIPGKKYRDPRDKDLDSSRDHQELNGESMPLMKNLNADEEMATEVVALKEKVDDLQRKLLEKDECSISQLNTFNTKLEELNQQSAQKDSVIKSTQHQLADLKIKLADKTAALEKVQWQLMTANQKVEQLQGQLDLTETSISSITSFLDSLNKNHATVLDDYDIHPILVTLPDLDELEETRIQAMEEAAEAYMASVAVANDKLDDESIAAAAQSRLRLQSAILSHSAANME